MDFARKLSRAWRSSESRLCVGLDPVLARLPADLAAESRPILAFNKRIVDLVGDLVCAFKPQHAHHAAEGAEEELAETIAYIRRRRPDALVILDGKRGDIGSTARMYAREAFERYDADAVTVNPFMGDAAVLPVLERPDRGAVVLCRTTNPDAARIQGLDVGGQPLFAAIAQRAETVWNARGNVMLVVGATAPADMAIARAAAPSLAFLVPGIGEQGGSVEAVLAAGRRSDGGGLIVSASRSILYAGDAAAIRWAAKDARDRLSPIVAG
ncbi:MAG: orotidine-5'-phosphate decarboxylase [Caulobacteraceae bacterium]